MCHLRGYARQDASHEYQDRAARAGRRGAGVPRTAPVEPAGQVRPHGEGQGA